MVRALSVALPTHRREEWVSEWEAELWHRCLGLERQGRTFQRTALSLAGRAAGALNDALAIRADHCLGVWIPELANAATMMARRPWRSTAALAVLSSSIALLTILWPVASAVLAPATWARVSGMSLLDPWSVLLVSLVVGVAAGLLSGAARAARALVWQSDTGSAADRAVLAAPMLAILASTPATVMAAAALPRLATVMVAGAGGAAAPNLAGWWLTPVLLTLTLFRMLRAPERPEC
jgi:hypothetical protein